MFNSDFDFSKMFDPNQAAQAWQNMMTMNNSVQQAMQSSQSSMEAMRKISTLWANTMSTCTEKQMQYCQSSIEDCMSAMRELSTAKGMEEYMQKQAKLSQQSAEKAQSTAQELAQCWQKTSTQCSDVMSQQLMQTMPWAQGTPTTTRSSK
ncbi:MAG: phasin family protein [Pseudomonadota bacterium]